MRDETGIIVPKGAEPVTYYEALRSSIRAAACEPLLVRAVITGEDFPDELQAQEVAAYVLAASEGFS